MSRRPPTAGGCSARSGTCRPNRCRASRLITARTYFRSGASSTRQFTGKRAFLGANAFATLKEIVEHEPAPLSTLVPSLPDGLERIVRTCLAKDPTQRYGIDARGRRRSSRSSSQDERHGRCRGAATRESPLVPDGRGCLRAGCGSGRSGLDESSASDRDGVIRPCVDRTPDDDRYGHRRSDFAGRAPARVGRVCRRHARPAAPSPRSGTDHRAGAGCGGRLLGDLVHARWLSRFLRDEERAEPRRSSVRGERAGRAVDARTRRDRQHDSFLARRPAHRVLSGRIP